MRRTNERTDDGSVEESEPCIETRQHKLLFDVGPDGTLFDNAGKLGIDGELSLFTVTETNRCRSPINDVLYGPRGRDDFSHEQDLLITEDCSALIMGCGHAGVVNIMDRVKSRPPAVCVGGSHLYDPATKKAAPETLLDEMAHALGEYRDTRFYACHCTGKKAFQYLARQMPNLSYLSCGETLEL